MVTKSEIEVEAHVLDDVREVGGGGWEIGHDHTYLRVPADSPIVPEVGMEAIFVGGWGRPVRGLFINGVKVWYRTQAEEEAHRQELIERQHEEDRKRFEQRRPTLDAEFAALPEPFQKWMQKFRDANPDYRWKVESYDMTIARDAVKIANAFKTAGEIETFRAWDWKSQKAAVPDLDEGHSGNTFGMAVKMAWLYKTEPEYIERFHSGMCMLMGCEEMGHKTK